MLCFLDIRFYSPISFPFIKAIIFLVLYCISVWLKKSWGKAQANNLECFHFLVTSLNHCHHQLLLSHVRLFETPWTVAHQDSLSITNSQSLLKLMSIKSVMPSNHLILCRPLLLLPSIFPSIRVFSNESVPLIKWPKYWSFSFSITPSNQYSGLISSRMDWLDLLAVQGALKSLLQHHSAKHQFFSSQLSRPSLRIALVLVTQ